MERTTSVAYDDDDDDDDDDIAPWSIVLPEKLTGPQPVQKFPAFYGTRSFIAEFASAPQISPSRARSIKSMPSHPTS
jgi:hypothetical protein